MEAMEESDVPLASTTIDLFDKHHRLRQGTWNLQLYKSQSADTTMQSKTPGLTTNPTTVDLNNLLIKIGQWKKHANTNPNWLDKASF